MPILASVRPRTGTAVAVALAAGFTLAGASAAFAAPGDSGDLTVLSTPSSWGASQRADAVCKFKIVADDFETLPSIAWTITSRPPTTPPGDTLTGNLALSRGEARSGQYTIPDGTYQLQWTAPSGVTKQKTFVVHCDDSKKAETTKSETTKAETAQAETSYEKPSGPVPAGGGGVPAMEKAASSSTSHTGTTTALAVGAAGVAGLVIARRAARRRSRGEA
ncbi:hypothetical protein [Streptomyces sp. NBC_00690]|uniref:hypothetical protein n=1 Tax=Streptomyces sp. NBC_00690 TaxID=2975808 RepID=UPI002E2B723D|nr:hypothetical protein [Streptomyces sp. NBC_00690]